jgi:predicted cupin superfamily sugar epimerase
MTTAFDRVELLEGHMASSIQGPGSLGFSDALPSSSLSPNPNGEFGRAQRLISALKLTYLPKESGYIGILGRSSQLVETHSADNRMRELAAQSHNYYMLTSQFPTNFLHWLEGDDTHILIDGGPLDYFVFHPSKSGAGVRAEKVTVGMDVEKGQNPVIAVPGGCWKALKLCEGVSYALTVNVLSPEFTEDRVRIGEGYRWVEQFAGKATWATEEFLKELIGDNLLHESHD